MWSVASSQRVGKVKKGEVEVVVDSAVKVRALKGAAQPRSNDLVSLSTRVYFAALLRVSAHARRVCNRGCTINGKRLNGFTFVARRVWVRTGLEINEEGKGDVKHVLQ